ncbi:ferritin-like domain-containing protein [Natrarchaeobius sp. A-rgal3]|uniref:YciE/YciF ferroxidase family protein n=1 Tax=Natrarchaeobius versutus TaxID=1679078 RepID=UPI00350ED26C
MSTTDATPRNVLTAQLERLYYVERTLRSELETLSADVAVDTLDDVRVLECREQLQYALDAHREESDRHVERIERAFDILDEEPDTRRVSELDGVIADKEKFNNVVLNDGLRPLYYIETTLKLEAIECTIYERTMALARTLETNDADEVLDALQENYDDERELRREIDTLAESESVETLLAANPVEETDRASLDR